MTQTETSKTARIRHCAFKSIRSFFDEQGFIEIDAPILLIANAVESQIDPLSTLVHPIEGDRADQFFLMTSPELHMKRLLAHGLENIFYLGHVFRDRESSPQHLNEFTMLEWYCARESLDHLIKQCEQLFLRLCVAAEAVSPAAHAQRKLFEGEFDRISMPEAWAKYAGIDLLSCLEAIALGDLHALTRAVQKSGESLRENADFDDAFTHIMLKKIEPQVGKLRPCVLYDWPSQTAALARLHPENPLLSQRFEIYCHGVELANAFAELTDSAEQRKRFIEANQIRRDQNKTELPISEDFLSDLGKMPPSCGISVGIDRLICLLTNTKDIREIICFTK